MVDPDGDPVGRVARIYLDRDSGQPAWALVTAPRRRRVFVPLSGAGADADRVRVVVASSVVHDAPFVPPRRRLTEPASARLSAYYGTGAGDAAKGAERAPGGSATTRLASAAGAASALAAGVTLARRSRRRRGGLAGTLDELVAAPAVAVRRRRRRRRARAAGRRLGGTVTAPVQAIGGLGAGLGRRVATLPAPLSRKRKSKMAGNLKLAAGLAAGYVLGARAGRERYERLAEMARQVADRPEVQRMAGRLRGSLGDGFDRATNRLSDRLERARSAQPSSRGPEGTPPEPKLPVPEVPEAELAEPGRVARARR